MARLTAVAIAMGLAATAAAQSQSNAPTTSAASGAVVTIPVPGGIGEGSVVGSIVGTASSLTTIVLACPAGTPSEDCGYNPPITVTYGASTLIAQAAAADVAGYTAQQNCVLLSNDAASCAYTFIGPISAIVESNSATNPATLTGITTSVQTQTYSAGEVERVPITLAAGQTVGASQTGTSTSGPTTLATSGTTYTYSSGTRSGATGASASSTNTSNEARVLVPGAFAAGLIGLAAVLL